MITFTVDAKRIQGLASNALNNQIDRAQAESFLSLFGEHIEAALMEAVRKLVVDKLGK